MFTSGVERQVLPNGLTVLAQRDASAPVVAVVTHVKAGYFDEPDEWVGIAHVLEHMFFKGTRKRGPGDLARETQFLGGYLNASTIYDKTVYHTVLPAAEGALERAVDIQSDALMNSVLDQQELSKELEVVIQEAKRKLDNPPALATETLYQRLFQVHRMRRWRIGTEEGLRRLDAEALRRYYSTRYAPARTIISLVGDLDTDEALDLATRVYGEWSTAPATIEGSPPEPPGARASLTVLSGDIERPLAVLGWRTTSELHPDTPALDMASAVLGCGRGSWLARFVRAPGIAASVSASHYTPGDVGVFDLTLQGDQPRLDDAVERALALVENLGQTGPDDAEMERIRSLVSVRWSRAFETVDGRAAALAEFEALGSHALADDLLDRTLSITADDIRRVASTYLARAAGAAVLYLPARGTSRFSGSPWPPAGGPGDPVQSPALPVLRNGRSARVGAGTAHDAILHIERRGLDLLVQSRRGAGLVSLGIFIPGMRDEEDAETAGISWLLARSALRGAAGMNAEELALAAESMGGAISASAGINALGWSMTVPVAELPRAARLLRGVAFEHALDPAQVEIERELQAADSARVRDDMYRYPLQRVLGLSFPGDPYGLPPLGRPEVVRAMDAALLRSWSAKMQGRRAVAIAVGDLENGKLAQGLAHLGTWPGGRSVKRVEIPRFQAVEETELRAKKQSALAMAFPGAAANTPRRFAVDVLGDFLSGLAGRLFQVLREERALAYTVQAAPWAQRRAGALLTYIATSPDRENEARDAMLATLQAVGTGDVKEEEVDRARRYAAGLVQVGRQTASAVMGEILNAWVNGLIDELPQLPGRLRAVTAEEVVREAGQIFGSDTRSEFVVRGTAG